METLNQCISELTTQVQLNDAEFMVLFMVFWLVASVLQNKFEINNED